MPIMYTTIVEEHAATRTAAGLFDISHMGRIYFDGDVLPFFNRVLTNRTDNLKPNQCRYSLVLNDEGMVLDDILIYRLPERYMLVVNASNRLKLLEWFDKHLTAYPDVTMTDKTLDTAMISAQGPKALEIVQPLVEARLADIRYYFSEETKLIDGTPVLVSRTGYTGEDGVEVIVDKGRAIQLWEEILAAGDSSGILPVGLGARDTLRLEAAMPLYGHEITEAYDPLQAGLNWAVKATENRSFIGQDALATKPADRPVRIGLQMDDKRIPREGYTIQSPAGDVIGVVTSGTFAPTLGASIAMGYVLPNYSEVGTPIAVVIRDKPAPAKVVSLPFYKRAN